ncbi:MAG: hypothetical protein ACQEQF_03090 [Bacillota bacterium]
MRENILFSLFLGIISYSLTVLINLLRGLHLSKVLYSGIIVFILVFILILLLVTSLSYFSSNSSKNKKGKKKVKSTNESTNNEKENNKQKMENEEDEFSPMDPTVLEVEEEEK